MRKFFRMLNIIVAMGKNRCIGKDGDMPWHLPADLRHFKQRTSGHPVVMGRKTYESIGKPLPNRTNIVITRSESYFQEGLLVLNSIKEALKFASKIDEEFYVIGGGEIFKETLPLADRMILTVIDAAPDGDTFFPEWDRTEWTMVSSEAFPADEKNPLDFSVEIWERNKD